MTERLCLETLPRLDTAHRPAVEPGALSCGIVHLGIGAFHRAHQAVYTEAAAAATGSSDWGICGVSQRSPGVLNTLAPQDFLYSVLEREKDESRLRVVGSLREVLFAGADPDLVIARLAAPTTRIVSLTVTEKGYHADLATGRLRVDEEVRADLGARVPRTAVGQLVRGLQRRRAEDAGPLTIIPCDNVSANGRTAETVVRDFCRLLPEESTDGLEEWISENVAFPSTMVDRIVPATSEEAVHEVQRRLGLRDEAALVTETFTQWVVEDRFRGARPAWEQVGVTFTHDVTPYELMKLRLVNASNSALAYLGLLAQLPHISDAVDVPEFAAYADALVRREMAPTIDAPPGTDVDAFCAGVVRRFGNPWLRHRTRQVAMDGTQKIPQRLLRPMAESRAAGREPVLAALAVAAWMAYVGSAASGGYEWSLEDPLADELIRVTGSAGSSAQRLVTGLLGMQRVFPDDVAQDEWFRATLTDMVADLGRFGPHAVVDAVLG
ncbi:mannitol dehydrogenase family protein [Blastococcus deserti]|uniref:Mannitol-1-phosphate 5-dehydrogenase n=1 Tax=Blastococcus deserti TaxID=2259033 RepID=A0ABW4XGG0_9ACTN